MNPVRRALSAVLRTGRLVVVSSPTVTGRGVQFVLAAVVAVVLPADEYGAFVVLQSFLVGTASVLGSVTAVSSNATAARAWRSGAAGRLPLLRAVLLRRRGVLVLNGLASAVVVAGGSVLLGGGTWGPEDLSLLLATGAATGAVPLSEAAGGVLAGTGRATSAAWLDGARAAAAAAAALMGALLGGPAAAAVGTVLPDLLVSAAVLVLVVRRRSSDPRTVAPVVLPDERDGLGAGVVAHVLGQAASWSVLGTIGAVAGAQGLGT